MTWRQTAVKHLEDSAIQTYEYNGRKQFAKRLLPVIPARGGSTGYPDKNIALMCGRSLIWWAARSVHKSKLCPNATLSTDDPRYIEEGQHAALHLHERQAACGDDATGLDAMRYHMDAQPDADAILWLQPTAPLRLPSHIDEAIEMWRELKCSIVSVCTSFSLSSVACLVDGALHWVCRDHAFANRQDAPPACYQRDGGIYLLTRKDVYADRGPMTPAPLIVPAEHNIQIDDLLDLKAAEDRVNNTFMQPSHYAKPYFDYKANP